MDPSDATPYPLPPFPCKVTPRMKAPVLGVLNMFLKGGFIGGCSAAPARDRVKSLVPVATRSFAVCSRWSHEGPPRRSELTRQLGSQRQAKLAPGRFSGLQDIFVVSPLFFSISIAPGGSPSRPALFLFSSVHVARQKPRGPTITMGRPSHETRFETFSRTLCIFRAGHKAGASGLANERSPLRFAIRGPADARGMHVIAFSSTKRVEAPLRVAAAAVGEAQRGES